MLTEFLLVLPLTYIYSLLVVLLLFSSLLVSGMSKEVYGRQAGRQAADWVGGYVLQGRTEQRKDKARNFGNFQKTSSPSSQNGYFRGVEKWGRRVMRAS